jgi:hypothetical protein
MMMKILAKGTLAAAVVGALLASTYGCDQPKAKCAAGRGAFAAVYKPVSGPPSCADLKGEQVGFGTYNQPGKEGKPNLDVAQIAIQPVGLGNLVDSASAAGAEDKDPTHKPYSLGFFTTAEPEGDFCTVPSLTVATQSIGAIAEDPDNEIPASPATTVTYTWSNVKLYVTPSALGTQFTADLVLKTDNTECGYKVQGMYPYVECGKEDPANPKKTIPDDLDGIARACAPEADEDAGRPTGSGINPDFPTHCDPDLLTCTLTKDGIPALK